LNIHYFLKAEQSSGYLKNFEITMAIYACPGFCQRVDDDDGEGRERNGQNKTKLTN
jgi:hypothetical protein